MTTDIISPGAVPYVNAMWTGQTETIGNTANIVATNRTFWIEPYPFAPSCPPLAPAPVFSTVYIGCVGAHCGHCCECTKRALAALTAAPTPAPASTPTDSLVAQAKARMAELERKVAEVEPMRAELERLRKMLAAAT